MVCAGLWLGGGAGGVPPLISRGRLALDRRGRCESEGARSRQVMSWFLSVSVCVNAVSVRFYGVDSHGFSPTHPYPYEGQRAAA